MTHASPRLSSVAVAIVLAAFAATPAVAGTVSLSLYKPSNSIAVAAASRALPVYNFFWAPADPPPFMIDLHTYMIMPGDDWSAGSPVDDGMLAAVIRGGSCQAGARYNAAQLRIGDRIHYMRDVLVTGCRPASARKGQAEWMTIAFAKVD